MLRRRRPNHRLCQRASLGVLARCLGAGGLLAAGLVGAGARAGASTATLDVVVVGSFDGGQMTGVVSAVVTPPTPANGTAPPQNAVDLEAACTDATPCTGTGYAVTWQFGDGTTGTGTQVTHTYSTPGVYVARATVTGPTSVGSSSITVLVSPGFADANPDTAALAAPSSRGAIWSVGAEEPLSRCRVALRGAGTDPWIPAGDVTGQSQLCPTPSGSFDGAPPGMPAAGTLSNGVTGLKCLTTPANCDLTKAVFARTASTHKTSPVNSCSAACQSELVAQGALLRPLRATTETLAVSPTNCGSGYTPAESNKGWSTAAGAPPGCMSRGTFFSELEGLVDHLTSTSRGLYRSGASMCADGPGSGTVAKAFERLNALGVTDTVTLAGTKYCWAKAGITKEQAYVALAQVAGFSVPTSCPATLRDLADETLGHGTATPDPNCEEIWSLLKLGVPLVGTTACATGGGSCFNGSDPLTNAQAYELLNALLSARHNVATGIDLSLVPSLTTVQPTTSVTLTATLSAPPTFPAGTTFTLTWPSAAAGVSSSTCAATTLTLGAAGTASATCTYTRALAGTTVLGATAADGSVSAQAVTTLTVSTQAPVFAATTVPATTQPAATAVTVGVTNPGSGTLRFSVRSAVPNAPDVSVYPTGAAPTRIWGQSATTRVGSVAIASHTATSVTITLSPAATGVGAYSFALQACNADTCSSETLSGTVNAATVVTDYAGTGAPGTTGDWGPATSAALDAPAGMAADGFGDVYLTDSAGNLLREVLANGTVIAVAGVGTSGTSGAGGLATSAQLDNPVAVALDAQDNPYLANRTSCEVDRVTNRTGVLSVVAGTGTCGTTATGSHLATGSQLDHPEGVAVNAAGDVYIANTGSCTVEEVTPAGAISVVAGTGTCGTTANGTATSEELGGPAGLSLDSSGALYIAETTSCQVAKLATGSLTVVAGTGTCGTTANGTATSEELNTPRAVSVTNGGRLYIVNQSSCQLDEVVSGAISVVAGTGTCATPTNGGRAATSPLDSPAGLALLATHPLVADTAANELQLLLP